MVKFTFENHLTEQQKKELRTLIDEFDFLSCGFRERQSGRDVVQYHGSFRGKDFKLLTQYGLFLLARLRATVEVLDIWEEASLVCIISRFHFGY